MQFEMQCHSVFFPHQDRYAGSRMAYLSALMLSHCVSISDYNELHSSVRPCNTLSCISFFRQFTASVPLSLSSFTVAVFNPTCDCVSHSLALTVGLDRQALSTAVWAPSTANNHPAVIPQSLQIV